MADEVTDVLCRLAHVLRGLVTVVGIVEHAVFQHVVFKIGGIELADEGAVHVEGGNAVFGTDKVGRLRVGHVLDIFL